MPCKVRNTKCRQGFDRRSPYNLAGFEKCRNMKQIKGLSDIIILCLYPESDCWNSIFLAILLSCLLQHLNLVLFVQHVPWWFTEPKILLWDAKIKLSWLCFTFVGNQLVVPVLISKWWTNWGSRARYVTHQRKSAKLAGNHVMLQLLGHKKTILLAFAPPFKASWSSSRKPSYQYTYL